MRRRAQQLKLTLWLTGCLVGVYGSDPRAIADDLEPGPGADVVMRACSMCHSIDHVLEVRKDRMEWEGTVSLMKNYGLQISDEEMQKVIDYLSANYGLTPRKSAPK